MDKYKKYTGIVIFILAVVVVLVILYMLVNPMLIASKTLKDTESQTENTLSQKEKEKATIEKRLSDLKASMLSAQKKIYAPTESTMGDGTTDTLFFTLYSDLIEMIRANSVKINSIEYKYNPEDDEFAKQQGEYLVYDIDLELVSNYVNLGKLVQDIYQYPYYIKIKSIEISPYPKDKKILLTSMSIGLYSRTSPEENIELNASSSESNTADGEQNQ